MEEGELVWPGLLEEGSRASREARIDWQLRLVRVIVEVDFRRLFGVGDEEAGIAVVDVEVVERWSSY